MVPRKQLSARAWVQGFKVNLAESVKAQGALLHHASAIECGHIALPNHFHGKKGSSQNHSNRLRTAANLSAPIGLLEHDSSW